MTTPLHTLHIRLEAFWQSWGTRSAFNDRDSLTRPTKSGLIGLLAAADGHDRDEHRTEGDDYLPLTTLAGLRFGVRADRPGSLVHDFQTSGGGHYPLRPRDLITDPTRADRAADALETATGPTFGRLDTPRLADWYGAPKNIAPHPDTHTLVAGNTNRHPQLSLRWYLADAAFLAAVESPDRTLLRHLARRLEQPRRLLWLGQKHCAPTQPLYHGLHQGSLETTLATTPLLPRSRPAPTHAWIEVPHTTPGAINVNDQPLSYASHHRVHGPRWEKRITLTPPEKP
ncbi:CRISPR-associated protein Cas5 [Streptomyces sp. RerS4]|uniref:CRISPR-associated protein Cas5 n=1 Tax=Streptomyces sp. RerS4 TaxID=2942449 RepID=UPI00201C4D11|nr:CRISPR-associated protein Cas5 [Streptomyces sp. RerS4]UQW99102.1 CRISPR-associated protein Cas5 [Streptomyces sp. RerS4]